MAKRSTETQAVEPAAEPAASEPATPESIADVLVAAGEPAGPTGAFGHPDPAGHPGASDAGETRDFVARVNIMQDDVTTPPGGTVRLARAEFDLLAPQGAIAGAWD